MKIAICDDEQSAIDIVKKHLKRYRNVEIYEYLSYEELLRHRIPMDVAFVDMEFGAHNGFEAVELLSSLNDKCIFSCFTNYSDFLKKGYEYRIFRYILKEEPEAFIERQIRETLEEFYNVNDFIKVKFEGRTNIVRSSEITYIEMLNHIAHIHIESGEIYKEYKTLNELEEELVGKKMIRCHRGFIVSIPHIAFLKGKTTFILKDGTRVPIGKLYKDKALDIYGSALYAI